MAQLIKLGDIDRPELQSRLIGWFEKRRNNRGPAILLLKGPRGSGKKYLLNKVLWGSSMCFSEFHFSNPENDLHFIHAKKHSPSFSQVIDCLLIAGSALGDGPVRIVTIIGKILRQLNMPRIEEENNNIAGLFFARIRSSFSESASRTEPFIIIIDNWEKANNLWREALALEARIFAATSFPISIILIQHYPTASIVMDDSEQLLNGDIKIIEVGYLSSRDLQKHMGRFENENSILKYIIQQNSSWLPKDLNDFCKICNAERISANSDIHDICEMDKSDGIVAAITERLILKLETDRIVYKEHNVRLPIRESLLLASCMGDYFDPIFVAKCVYGFYKPQLTQYEWGDIWEKFLFEDNKKIRPLAIEYVKGQAQGKKLCNFIDSKLGTLLKLESRCILNNIKSENGKELRGILEQAYNILNDCCVNEKPEYLFNSKISLLEFLGKPYLANCLVNQRRLQRLLIEYPQKINESKKWIYDNEDKKHIYFRLVYTYGCVLMDVRHHQGALPVLKEALELNLNLRKYNWQHAADILKRMCTAHCECGSYGEAEKVGAKAICICNQHKNENPEIYADVLNVIGCSQIDNNPSSALNMFRQAITEYLNTDMPHKYEIARIKANMGSALSKLGLASQALKYYEESFVELKEHFYWDHPEVGEVLLCMGNTYNIVNNYEESLRCLRGALKIFQNALPPIHMTIAFCLNNLAATNINMGQYEAGMYYLKKSNQILNKISPPNYLLINQNIRMENLILSLISPRNI